MGIEAVKKQKVEKPREKWRSRLRLQIAGSQKNDPLPECSAEKKKKHIPKLPISKYVGFGAIGRRPYTYILLVHLTQRGGELWGRMQLGGRMNP